jgi:hypothetical protein
VEILLLAVVGEEVGDLADLAEPPEISAEQPAAE